LFNYRRDDTAAGQITHVHIHAARVGVTPIQQSVFGNFIEHLADLVYQVLWANALQNPNLERLADDNVMPPYWDTAGATAWPDTGGYLSAHFVRLSAADGSLSQWIFLPVHRTRRYTLTLYARATGGPGRLSLALRAGDDKAGTGLPVQQATLSVAQAAWRKFTLHWVLPEGRLAKGQAARFFVTHAGGPDVDVDQIELFPDDAVDGMDPDVIRLARAWNIPVLRLAGNFSSGYHWRDGVGPRLARPTYRNFAWRGVETNQFGTDEFLDFSHRIGATPQIAANAGNGTPEEAADWVRYCNGK
jgi:alpha-N-arabinofuranosidase